MTKRIFINAGVLKSLKTGVETSLFNLLESFARQNNGYEFQIACKASVRPSFAPSTELHFRTEVPEGRWARLVWEHGQIRRIARRTPFDLYHFPTYVLPWRFQGKSLLTCHDLIALHSPDLCHPRTRRYYQLGLAPSFKQARHIVAVSATVGQQIARRFPALSAKVSVIPNIIASRFAIGDRTEARPQIQHRLPFEEPFVLFTGHLEAKKNVALLIRAFAELKRHTEITHRLVIAGAPGWRFREIQDTLARLDHPDWAVLTGFIPDNELPALYRAADLFVFPSLYEGFGMPPLEALACGTPVLCSRRGALPEVMGRHAYFVEADSIAEIAKGMKELILEGALRKKLMAGAADWVGQYRSETIRNQYLQLYERLIDDRPPSSNL